jgi:hypothetical protein
MDFIGSSDRVAAHMRERRTETLCTPIASVLFIGNVFDWAVHKARLEDACSRYRLSGDKVLS